MSSTSSKGRPGLRTKAKGKQAKDKWSDLELHALVEGVSRYGSSRRPGINRPWRSLLSDPQLSSLLSKRLKYNACKDKFRNLYPSLRLLAFARFTANFA